MERPLHVVFLSHVARFSGAEIEMLRTIEATDELQATVLLAEDGPLVAALEQAGARVEVLPLSERARTLKRSELQAGRTQIAAALEFARYVGRIRQRLVKLKPDVVSTISLKAGIYGTSAARLAGLPVVFHLHDQIAAKSVARPAVLPTRLVIGTLPSAVIAPSQSPLDIVGWFRPGLRTGVIPAPIPMPSQPASVRPTVERIGMVGRIAPWKGQDVFLRAFAQAFPDSTVRAVLIGNAMFGEEDFENELHGLVSELGIADRVDFLGFRRDVQGELAGARCARPCLGPVRAARDGDLRGDGGGSSRHRRRDRRSGRIRHARDERAPAQARRRERAGRDAVARRRGLGAEGPFAAAGRERVREFSPEAVVKAGASSTGPSSADAAPRPSRPPRECLTGAAPWWSSATPT